METFCQMGLSESMVAALSRMSIDKPTPIQAQSIPTALQGKDILGSAQTGTGKTLAFGVPMVEYLAKEPKMSALIITPTRELATQVLKSLERVMPQNLKKKTALLIGGSCMRQQHRALNNKPRVIVGTPGRINDHLQRKSLSIHNVGYFVLDETDRMLDMGFSEQIETICEVLPANRQTMLFSATLPAHITNVAKKYLQNPEVIKVAAKNTTPQNIKHEVQFVPEHDKFDVLIDQLNQREGTIIVFVKTKRAADKMAMSLKDIGYEAEPIHGDLRQSRRERTIRRFRSSQFRILVATDVAARGLDVPHVSHVINYDLPQCSEDYIHRIGRTGRAGATGEAICFVSKADQLKWKHIDRLMNPGAAKDRPRRQMQKSQKSQKPRKWSGSGSSEGKSPFSKKGFSPKKRSGAGKKPETVTSGFKKDFKKKTFKKKPRFEHVG